MPFFPVAAVEDPLARIDQGDEPFTADDLREVASSYDRAYRAASVICGYDDQTGESGDAHFVGRIRPEVAPILSYRFNEGTQELEAEFEVTQRLTAVFDRGFRTPSINIVKFPDHPDGPREYGQHVAMVGPGEVEVIAGLGGDRWKERFRSHREAFSGRRHMFRPLTDQEIQMSKKAEPAPASEATETKVTEKSRAADPEKVETKPEKAVHEDEDEDKKKTAKSKLRAVADDPQDETRQQVADLTEMMRAQTETVNRLAGIVKEVSQAGGDLERIRTAADEAEQLVKDGRKRATLDNEARIKREVEALASGEEPRLRTAEVDDEVEALLALPTDKAEARLERRRAQDPIALNLGREFLTDHLPEELPAGFNVNRFRTNGDVLPSGEQVRQFALLSADGKDPVAVALAREQTQNLRRAYRG